MADLAQSVGVAVTRIAGEFKTLRAQMGVPTFIQETQPAVTGPAIWYQTDALGNIIKKWVQTS